MPGTPANSLNLTYAGIVRFDGVSVFSGLGVINHAVLIGASTNAITSLGPTATAGQILQSAGSSADPVFSTATYPATAGTSGNLLTSDGTNWTSAAPAAAGVTSVSGTANRITSTGGATPVIDIDATYVGQTSITTLGTIATGTWSATTIAANKGGTGTVTNTNHGVLIGQGASAIAATAAGTAGQVLQSGGAAADPVYSTATYPATAGTSGKVLISDGTNIISSTPTFPNASASSGKFIRSDGTNWIASTPTLPTTAGTAGKVLMSNATNYIESTPTYPSASGSTGQILRSDGTNNVYTTATYPATATTTGQILRADGTNWTGTTATYPNTAGTSGNVLTSDGTNWASSAASSGIVLTVTKTLTSAQIKLIHATPIEMIAAPGAGKGILVIGVAVKFIYGGTNVFTAAAAQSIQLYYNAGTTQLLVLLGNAMIISAASKFSFIQAFTVLTNQVAGVLDNVNLVAANPVVTEIGGNAAGDNTIDIILNYIVVTF